MVEWRGGEQHQRATLVKRTEVEEAMRREPTDISKRSCGAQERMGQGLVRVKL
jgi:hypothetical protein